MLIFISEYMNKEITHKKKADLLKALGHPIRFCIVEGLIQQESNVNQMVACIGIPQPTVSQHLNILKAAGIIEGRRDGAQIIYSVSDPTARDVVNALK